MCSKLPSPVYQHIVKEAARLKLCYLCLHVCDFLSDSCCCQATAYQSGTREPQ